jgi:hypothetical protein
MTIKFSVLQQNIREFKSFDDFSRANEIFYRKTASGFVFRAPKTKTKSESIDGFKNESLVRLSVKYSSSPFKIVKFKKKAKNTLFLKNIF